jgi:pyruvate dehydrogenase E1 component beta subunit
MPATPADAKGLLMNAIFGDDPTIVIEGRSLFSMKDEVPEEPYRVPFGHASVRRVGSDISVVALGHMVPMALKAAENLQEQGISAEIIDLRTVVPLDEHTVLKSVAKTGRMVIADPAWKSFGVSAEISARITEQAFDSLKAPISRIAFPDVHAPSSSPLEDLFYPEVDAVVACAKSMVENTR